jgi:hypothetical protein
MYAVPAATAAETLSRTANGLRDMVAANKGRPALQSIMEFFEVSDSRIASMASSAGRVGKGALKAFESPVGAIGAFGLANAVRQVREGRESVKQMNMQEQMMPNAKDLFEESMLNELRSR